MRGEVFVLSLDDDRRRSDGSWFLLLYMRRCFAYQLYIHPFQPRVVHRRTLMYIICTLVDLTLLQSGHKYMIISVPVCDAATLDEPVAPNTCKMCDNHRVRATTQTISRPAGILLCTYIYMWADQSTAQDARDDRHTQTHTHTQQQRHNSDII